MATVEEQPVSRTARYWVFQAKWSEQERVYNLAESLVPGRTENWRAEQHKSDIKRGDIVYFWQAGGVNPYGVYGWGTVLSPEPFPDSDPDLPFRTNLLYQVLFQEPLSRELILQQPLLNRRGWVFSGQTGTNFPLTDDEARALADLFPKSASQLLPDRIAFDDSQLTSFDALDSGTRSIMESAEIQRQREVKEGGKPLHSRVHMQHLLYSLLYWSEENVRSLFVAIGKDPGYFLEALKRVGKLPEETDSTVSVETRLPDLISGLSGHARQALAAANYVREAQGVSQIAPIHLLTGALMIRKCRAISAILDFRPLKEAKPAFSLRNKAISDWWTLDDRLGYAAYANAIAYPILKGYWRPPLAISIQAPWGQGKTSLMRMIQEGIDPGTKDREASLMSGSTAVKTTFRQFFRLLRSRDPVTTPLVREAERENRIVTVWFNPLAFETSQQIWSGFAHAILHQLAAHLPTEAKREEFWLRLKIAREGPAALRLNCRWWVLQKVIKNPFVLALNIIALVLLLAAFLAPSAFEGIFTVLTEGQIKLVSAVVTLLTGLLSFGITHGVNLAKSLNGPARNWIPEPDYYGQMGFLQNVNEDLNRALRLLVKDQTVAIFVDDLDRCTPNVVGEVVLAIYRFMALTAPKFIFVLGMDMQMVAGALEAAHEKLAEQYSKAVSRDKSFGWEFMEKFVQVPFFIPHLEKGVAREFLGSFIKPFEENTEIEKTSPDTSLLTDISERIKSSDSIEKIATASREVKQAVESGQIPQDKVPTLFKDLSQQATDLMSDPESEEIGRLVDVAIKDLAYNPRTIKRFVNLVGLLRHIQVVQGGEESSEKARLSVVRTAHLIMNWPQAVGWLQASASVNNASGNKQSAIEVIEAWARDKKDYEDWKALVKGKWGSNAVEVLGHPSLHEFVRRLAYDGPGLSDIQKAGLL